MATEAKSSPEEGLTLLEYEAGTYRVSSSRRDGEVNVYTVRPDGLSCDCAAGKRHRSCRHLRFILARLHADA